MSKNTYLHAYTKAITNKEATGFLMELHTVAGVFTGSVRNVSFELDENETEHSISDMKSDFNLKMKFEIEMTGGENKNEIRYIDPNSVIAAKIVWV